MSWQDPAALLLEDDEKTPILFEPTTDIERRRRADRERQARLRESKRLDSERRRERDRRVVPLRAVRGGDCCCGAPAMEHALRVNGKLGACTRTDCPEYFEKGR